MRPRDEGRRLKRRRTGALPTLSVTLVIAMACRPAREPLRPEDGPTSLAGIYRASDGTGLALTRRAGHPDSLRVNALDGRVGVAVGRGLSVDPMRADSATTRSLEPTVHPSDCDAQIIQIGLGSPPIPWRRLPLRVTYTTFMSRGETLRAELIEPRAERSRPPLFVYVHGSEARRRSTRPPPRT
jgi:hypothetical protein